MKLDRLQKLAPAVGFLLIAAGPPPSYPQALFQQGLRAELGEGQPVNVGGAYRLYRMAAGAGYAPAELNVAIMQDSGRGTRHDSAQAAVWYARAAARGNGRAQYDLALLYADGDGVPRNQSAARAWFQVAAANGITAAKQWLGPDATTARPTAGEVPTPARPVAPADGASIIPAMDGLTEFVWSAAAKAPPIHYTLQVMVIEDGVPHELEAKTLDVTASLLRLDPLQQYAWRVYSVSARSQRYSVSSWNRFKLTDAAHVSLPAASE